MPSRSSDLVDDGRRGRDEVHVVFALEPLLHDVHVQQAEEAAAKAEAQRLRDFRLVVQRRVVELQLRRARRATLRTGSDSTGNSPANTCGFTSLKPGSGAAAGRARKRDRVADVRVAHFLDAGDDEADFAGRRAASRATRLRREHADLLALGASRRSPSAGSCRSAAARRCMTRTSMTTPT